MGDLASISQNELTERRRQLRRQRRFRIFGLFWRTVVVLGFTGGIIWTVSLPGWIIKDSSQIEIEGNELLSDQLVRSLLPVNYPIALWNIDAQDLTRYLQTNGPIADVIVHRQLFPPGITIHIQERSPMAILLGGNYKSNLNTALSDKLSQSLSDAAPFMQSSLQASRLAPTGIINENGVLIPITSFELIKQSVNLPKLLVIGMQESYRQYWPTLYKTLQESQVKIFEMDWSNPANLILNTDLGIVHLGSYSNATFKKQLETLDQMRYLSEKVDLNQVDYIDLTNPDSPLIQMLNQSTAYQLNPMGIEPVDAAGKD